MIGFKTRTAHALHRHLADLVFNNHRLALLDNKAAGSHVDFVLQLLERRVSRLKVDLREGVALRCRRGIGGARQDLADLAGDLNQTRVAVVEEGIVRALLLQNGVDVEAQALAVDLGADKVGAVDELGVNLDGVARLRDEGAAVALVDGDDADVVEAALGGTDGCRGVDGDLQQSVGEGNYCWRVRKGRTYPGREGRNELGVRRHGEGRC